MPATLRMVLGGVLALVTLLACSFTGGTARAAAVDLVAQRWVSMPAPTGNENSCALESEVVDVDDDDSDGESSVPGDDPSTCHFASAIALGCSGAERDGHAPFEALSADKSRFAIDTRLARGPPVMGEVAPR